MRGKARVLYGLVLALAVSVGGEAADKVVHKRVVEGGASYNGTAFEYKLVELERHREHTVYRVEYPTPQPSGYEPNDVVHGELYMPAGVVDGSGLPGVVCMHILSGSFDLERLMCARLARSGVVAMFFKQPYYGERGGRELVAASAQRFTAGLEQGLEDARRAVDLLQSLPEVNREQIGITGISMGALQSAAVCGREPRIGSAFLMLGGGNLRRIIESARETRVIRAMIGELPDDEQEQVWQAIERTDPLRAVEELKRLAASDSLRMVCAAEDEVIPAECSRVLADAVGFGDRVVWLEGMGHYTAMASFPVIVEDVAAFFGRGVPEGWQPAKGEREASGYELLGSFLSGVATMASGEPEEETAHMAGFDGSFRLRGKEHKLSFSYAKGWDGRFRLEGNFPEVGRAGFGMGLYPWIMSGSGGVVFCGERGAGPAHAAELVSAERLLRFKVAAGALAGVALSPEALQKYYKLSELEGEGGERVIELLVDYKRTKGRVVLRYGGDGVTPTGVSWEFGESRGDFRVTHWRLSSVADRELFNAPQGVKQQSVMRRDVMQMLAAVFEYVVESAE